MVSLSTAKTPHVSRRKRPIRHGLYLRNDKQALRLRGAEVKRFMHMAVNEMPWLKEAHLPTLRKWAELEVVRRAAFAGLVATGIWSVDKEKNELSCKRLVHDWRQLVQTQLVVEAALLMTPASRAQLGPGDEPVDIVALMARSDTETVEAGQADAEPGEPEAEAES